MSYKTSLCLWCGKEFRYFEQPERADTHQGMFCSRDCCSAYKSQPNIKCDGCGKMYHEKAYRIKKNKEHYCCQHCRVTTKVGAKHNAAKPKREVACATCGKIILVSPSRNTMYCSMECKNVARRGSKAPWVAGDKNVHWKGGITQQQVKDRMSAAYKIWRNAVYKRDRWTCQTCGKHCDSKSIVAHHIYPWADFIELRYEVTNGITMCRSCHKITQRRELEFALLFSLYQAA